MKQDMELWLRTTLTVKLPNVGRMEMVPALQNTHHCTYEVFQRAPIHERKMHFLKIIAAKGSLTKGSLTVSPMLEMLNKHIQ